MNTLKQLGLLDRDFLEVVGTTFVVLLIGGII